MAKRMFDSNKGRKWFTLFSASMLVLQAGTLQADEPQFTVPRFLEAMRADEIPSQLIAENVAAGCYRQAPESCGEGQKQMDTRKIIIKHAKGLVLLGSYDDVLTRDLDAIDGMYTVNLDVPGGSGNLAKILNPIYLGQDITSEKIAELKRAIVRYYKDQRHPLVMVQVPQQDVTEGVLQLVVIEGRISKIKVEGNKWFSSEKLSSYLRLQPNEQIDEDQLMQDLNFINRNPFRRVDVIYAPGEEPGMTEIKLLTNDHWPWRFYVGGENTGVQATGRQRWIAGVNWGNAWGLDHILSYQYSASSDFHKFQAHTAQYQVPLSWKHVLNFYGGYSQVRARLPFPGMKNNGNSVQVSGRYMAPLKPMRSWIHEVYGGVDWKRTNNTVEFGGITTPIVAQNANLFQLMAGYAGNLDISHFRMSMDIEIFYSPFQFLPNQNQADYDSLTPDAKVKYIYGRTSWAFLVRLPVDFSVSAIVRGQYSSTNLLPTEQFGIGGYSTVRGYEERQLNFEQAVLGSLELRTPTIPIIKRYVPKVTDALQFLAFIDWGWGAHHTYIHNAAPGTNVNYLAGTGVGIRYAIDQYLSSRLDWGYKIRQEGNFGGGTNLFHFAVIGSY